MEVVVDRHGEPCQRRTAAAMQVAVRKEIWPTGVAETGRDQATDQQEVKTHRFPLASGWGRWAVGENGCLELDRVMYFIVYTWGIIYNGKLLVWPSMEEAWCEGSALA
jgi:hypothetical protein